MNIALYLTLAALIGCTWRLYRTKQRAARYYQTLMIVNAILANFLAEQADLAGTVEGEIESDEYPAAVISPKNEEWR